MKKLKFFGMFTAILLICAMLFSCASATRVELPLGKIRSYSEESLRVKGEPYHLVVLATSDIHGNIWGYSYEDGKETSNNGMVREASYIKEQRALHPHLLLIDAGDAIQGTIMTDDIYNKHPELTHPMIEAFNAMKYDALTLGNHEFNWGITRMQQILKNADFPILAANVKNKNGNYITGRGHIIIERDGVKVGIIGVVTPDVPIWDGGKEGIDKAIFEAANIAVKNEIAEIKDEVDVIIVQAHLGEYAEFDEENGSDSGDKILEDNPEIDILQLAHNHVVINKKKGKTLIGAVRNLARDIARFELVLDDNNRIIDSHLSIIDMQNYPVDNALRVDPIIKEAHEKTIEYIRGGVSTDGSSKGATLGSTTAKFQPENEIRGLPEGKLRDTPVMHLINKVQLLNSGADVSAAALFKDTSDLPEGDLNYGNIFDIYKFDNTLYKVKVTGRELKNYMEWSAECYNMWTEGDINISFDPEYPGYLYDMFLGVDYEIDLSEPKGKRIKNVMYKGHPLSDTEELYLAVNNYRYSSALKGKGLVSGKKEWESSSSIRDMLVDYIKKNSPLKPEVANNWHITGVNLYKNDQRRLSIINKINDGELESPYNFSYKIDSIF